MIRKIRTITFPKISGKKIISVSGIEKKICHTTTTHLWYTDFFQVEV